MSSRCLSLSNLADHSVVGPSSHSTDEVPSLVEELHNFRLRLDLMRLNLEAVRYCEQDRVVVHVNPWFQV